MTNPSSNPNSGEEDVDNAVLSTVLAESLLVKCQFCGATCKDLSSLQQHQINCGGVDNPDINVISHEEIVDIERSLTQIYREGYSDAESGDSDTDSYMSEDDNYHQESLLETSAELSASQSILEKETGVCNKCSQECMTQITCIACGYNTCGPCTGVPMPEDNTESDICHILNVLCSYNVIVTLCKTCQGIFDGTHTEKVIIERSMLRNKLDAIVSLENKVNGLTEELKKCHSEKEALINESSCQVINVESRESESSSGERIDTAGLISLETTEDGDENNSSVDGGIMEKNALKHGPNNTTDGTLAEIKAINKMLIYKNRPEGPISISGRSKNLSSINVFLETAVMQATYPKIESDFMKRFPEITDVSKYNQVKISEKSSRETYSELHYNVSCTMYVQSSW